ncbi:MAG: hypothetical protein EOP62_02970, partial [Sphingomonadales bacterium]
MARDSGPHEVRFPLRRQAEAEPETPAPAPTPPKPETKIWRPKPAKPEPLELSGGMPPPRPSTTGGDTIFERARRAVLT